MTTQLVPRTINFYSCKNYHIEAIEKSLFKTKLKPEQRDSLLDRFITLLHDYNQRKQRYSWSFHTLRIIVTVGSLIVPAVLSVQYTSGNVTAESANLSAEVYWIVWTLSLFVTISNGIMTLLKMDKKYHSLHTTFEQLVSEAWQFVQLSGKYGGSFTPDDDPTHENQLPFFCYYIEKVRMKHVEDEYYKTVEQKDGVTETQQKTPWRDIFSQQRQYQPQKRQTQSSPQQVNDDTTTVTVQTSNAAS